MVAKLGAVILAQCFNFFGNLIPGQNAQMLNDAKGHAAGLRLKAFGLFEFEQWL